MQPSRYDPNRIRVNQRWRKMRHLLEIAAIFSVFLCGVIILLALLGPTQVRIFRTSDVNGYIKGDPKYCRHFMIDNRGVRLVYRAFAQPGHGIDPNDWESDPGAFDLRAYGWIVIPWFDF